MSAGEGSPDIRQSTMAQPSISATSAQARAAQIQKRRCFWQCVVLGCLLISWISMAVLMAFGPSNRTVMVRVATSLAVIFGLLLYRVNKMPGGPFQTRLSGGRAR